MLSIKLPENEVFDDNAAKFVRQPELTLRLEHSLLSISKWESIWKKPFLSTEGKSTEETISYIRCMTLTRNVDDLVLRHVLVQARAGDESRFPAEHLRGIRGGIAGERICAQARFAQDSGGL